MPKRISYLIMESNGLSPTKPPSVITPPPSAPRTHGSDSSSSNGSELTNNNPAPPARKRRAPGAITPNACTNCKKARAKCNGIKPACKRCTARNINDSCHYEVHAKTAKEQMMREIQRLQRENRSLEDQKDNLSAENSSIQQIILSLKDDGQCVEILHRLKQGQSYQDITKWLGRAFVQETEVSPVSEFKFDSAIEKYHRDFVKHKDPRYWTSVTTDASLIEHLLTLYFNWVHPVHTLFDETHFMSSLRDCVDVYCSAALVNGICAMSCYLLHNTWEDEEQTRQIIVSLRGRFIDEARVLLKGVDNSKWTNIQTYAIFFLIELSMGNGLMATAHLRLATEALTAKGTAEQSSEAVEVTRWGIITLHTAWSGLTYVKPSAPVSPMASVFQGIAFDEDGHFQGEFHPDNVPARNRPSYTVLTASELARLYRVIHETILLYCGTKGKVSAHHLIKVYERFLAWKDQLPSQISHVADDHSASPHALSLHIQYYTALVHLFQPLLSVAQTPRASHKAINDLLFKYAREGLALLIQYRKAYGTFHQSPLQFFCMIHICDAIMSHDGQGGDTADTVRFCIESLEDAKFGYPVAGPLQRMFANRLIECNISLPNDLENLVGSPHIYQLEDILNVCARSSYTPPITQILQNFEPSLAQDFMDEWQAACDQHPQTNLESPTTVHNQKSMHIDTLLN